MSFMDRIQAEQDNASRLDEMTMRKSSIIDYSGETTSGGEEAKEGQSAVSTEPNWDRSAIFKLFFGKMTQILKVKNDERSKECGSKEDKMGPIMLNVNDYSNLYEAWKAQQFEEVEGYDSQEVAESFYVQARNRLTQSRQNQSSSSKVSHPTCIKENWISQLPKALIFNLNRVFYDREKQCLGKNSKRFEFDEVICADRFVHQYNDKEKEINEHVKMLREREKGVR